MYSLIFTLDGPKVRNSKGRFLSFSQSKRLAKRLVVRFVLSHEDKISLLSNIERSNDINYCLEDILCYLSPVFRNHTTGLYLYVSSCDFDLHSGSIVWFFQPYMTESFNGLPF